MKICTVCKIEKDKSEFYFNKDYNYFVAKCKKCYNTRRHPLVNENVEIYLEKTYGETRPSEKNMKKIKDFLESQKNFHKIKKIK